MIAEAATIDILYVAFNRKEMTQASFTALRQNTAWEQVRTLYVVDDGSEDGTLEWLERQQMDWKAAGGVQASYGADLILWDQPSAAPWRRSTGTCGTRTRRSRPSPRSTTTSSSAPAGPTSRFAFTT